MEQQINSVYKTSVAASILYILLFIPGWICAIIASAKALKFEKIKGLAIATL